MFMIVTCLYRKLTIIVFSLMWSTNVILFILFATVMSIFFTYLHQLRHCVDEEYLFLIIIVGASCKMVCNITFDNFKLVRICHLLL